MTVQENIINNMKTAMREKNVELRDFLRVVMAEFNREGKVLSDDESYKVLTKMVKNAKVMSNDAEVAMLKLYLPSQMDELELKRVCMNFIMNLNSPTMKDMGKVMSFLKENHAGTYDGKMASTIVRELLK